MGVLSDLVLTPGSMIGRAQKLNLQQGLQLALGPATFDPAPVRASPLRKMPKRLATKHEVAGSSVRCNDIVWTTKNPVISLEII